MGAHVVLGGDTELLCLRVAPGRDHAVLVATCKGRASMPVPGSSLSPLCFVCWGREGAIPDGAQGTIWGVKVVCEISVLFLLHCCTSTYLPPPKN